MGGVCSVGLFYELGATDCTVPAGAFTRTPVHEPAPDHPAGRPQVHDFPITHSAAISFNKRIACMRAPALPRSPRRSQSASC